MANVLGVDMGMFYKRRDYSRIVDGRNPIVAHEFLGQDVEGRDIIVIDDMISSGDSVLDIVKELKKRKARKVFIAATFGLFTHGMDEFDAAYEKGWFDCLMTTNAIYQKDELFTKPYYISVDISKYLALLIDTLNTDSSVDGILNPVDKIQKLIKAYKNHEVF